MAANDQNEFGLPTSKNDSRTTASLLPRIYRSSSNQKFLQATLDQLTQPGTVKKVNGYIGRKNGKAVNKNDIFIKATDDNRQNYQLEPAATIQDYLGNINFYKDYIDHINHVETSNGIVNNHERLNSQEFYSWNPHIDWDKFVNYRNYYWLPTGPTAIELAGQQQNIQSTFTVAEVDNGNNYTFLFTPDGLTNNPTITLYRGQTYVFDITSPNNPFSIKTTRSAGELDRYTDGITGNGITTGRLVFEVPYNAPNVLFYTSEKYLEAGGAFHILDIDENTFLNVEKDILGKKTYRMSNGTELSNGMKLQFTGRIAPEVYAVGSWYVEGVGKAIKLVNEKDLEIISSYSEDVTVLFDDEPFDQTSFSSATAYSRNKDYIVINRASADKNPWSRYNRWFHQDVIAIADDLAGDVPNLDQLARATRPIIEFESGLKLFNFGHIAKADVDLIDRTTVDVFSTVEGSLGYSVDGISLVDGMRVIFSADTDGLVKNKIYNVNFINLNKPDYTLEFFGVSSVNTIDDTVKFSQVHKLSTGNSVIYRNNGNPNISGLLNSKTYYVSVVNSYTIILYTNKELTEKVDILGTSVGTHKFDVSSGASRQIHLTEATDATPLINEVVMVRQGQTQISTGVTSQGKMYWYDGAEWVLGPIKTKVNQTPLFDVFDKSGVSYGDTSVYDGSTFIGSSVFSYKTNSAGSNDTELGFPLSYQNINNIGDILFEFNLLSDTFTYKNIAELVSQNTDVGYLKSIKTLDEFIYVNGWTISEVKKIQPIVRTFKDSDIIDNFPIDVYDNVDDLADLEVRVFVNGVRLSPSLFRVDTGTVRKFVKLFVSISATDVVTLKCFAKQPKNNNGYYELPINLQNNALNNNIVNFTLGEVINHVDTIVENLPEFTGAYPGAGNLRDLGNITPYGVKFVQHSSPLALSLFHLGSKDFNILKSVQESRDDYGRFKRAFLVTALNSGIDTDTRRHVDHILSLMFKNKSKSEPYYFSDMFGHGAYNNLAYTVDNARIKRYPMTNLFNLTTLSNSAVNVYINGEQLTHGRDYVFGSDHYVEILVDLIEDAVIEIIEYVSTDGAFCPPTPTKLGLYPLFEPSKYIDDTYLEPTEVIQGHDGSIIVAFGDYRDDLILELEKRIFNNIKIQYNTEKFNINDFIPHYGKDTSYSRDEFNKVLGTFFYQWTTLIGQDFTKQTSYDRLNAFTFNYRDNFSPDGQSIPAFWRGIYTWFFGTDRPHTHPWECLEYTIEPSWWQEVYGPAPYTGDNLILWDDIRQGMIRQPGMPPKKVDALAKSVLEFGAPVDSNGKLKPPADCNFVQGVIKPSSEGYFVFGDQSPVETAWHRSSYYPFAILQTLSILQPCKTLALCFDLSRTERNNAGQLVYTETNLRIKLEDIVLPSTPQLEVRRYASGLVNYVVESITSDSTALITQYSSDLKTLKVKIGSKLGGFTSKEKFNLILDSKTPSSVSGVFVPTENYNIFLNTSSPVKKLNYSGIIITKFVDGFEVRGYNFDNPFFKFYSYQNTDRVINVGGISESFLNWTEERTYVAGSIVKHSNQYYRTKSTFTSNTTFVDTNLVKLATLPMAGGVNVEIRKSFDKNNELVIGYGTKLGTIQEVADFIQGYSAYLESQGFIFDTFNSNLQQMSNWETSLKEFLFWTTQNWGEGAVISLSPSANLLTISSDYSVVNDIFDDFYGYQIFRVDGQKLENDFTSIIRTGNTFSLQPTNTNHGIYGATLYLVQKEHALLLDNRTLFNDVIYDVEPGFRQERIKVLGYLTTNWSGGFNIPGFIFDEARIEDWQLWVDYKIGSVVKYGAFYYSAVQTIEGAINFDETKWNRLVEKPQKTLKANWDYRSQQFTDFYDLDTSNFDAEQQKFAQHLIGYQRRQYLENIIQDDVSQYNFYQGYIREKGTQNSLSKLFDVLSADDMDSLTFNEEWALRVGQYGASAGFNEIEFVLDQSQFKLSPQPIELVNIKDTTLIDFVYRQSPSDVYIKPLGYNNNPWPVTGTKQFLRTPGFVRYENVKINVDTLDDLLTEIITDVQEGDYIWAAFENALSADYWGIYRLTKTEFNPIAISYDKNTLTISCNDKPTVSAGDIIGIINPNFINGFYKVSSVKENKIIIQKQINGWQEIPTPSNTLLFTLTTSKTDSVDNINNILPYDVKPGELVWASDNGRGLWTVYQNNTVYANRAVDSSVKTSNNNFGKNLAISDDGTKAVVISNNHINILTKTYTSSVWGELQTTDATTSVTNFGKKVKFSHDSKIIAVLSGDDVLSFIEIYQKNNIEFYELVYTIPRPATPASNLLQDIDIVTNGINSYIISASTVTKTYFYKYTYQDNTAPTLLTSATINSQSKLVSSGGTITNVVVGVGYWTVTVTGLASTANLEVGCYINVISQNSPTAGTGGLYKVLSIVQSTNTITYKAVGGIMPVGGLVSSVVRIDLPKVKLSLGGEFNGTTLVAIGYPELGTVATYTLDVTNSGTSTYLGSLYYSTPTSALPYNGFGYSIDVSHNGDHIAVGSPYLDNGSVNAGAVLVFKYDATAIGAPFTKIQEIVTPKNESTENYGKYVQFMNETATLVVLSGNSSLEKVIRWDDATTFDNSTTEFRAAIDGGRIDIYDRYNQNFIYGESLESLYITNDSPEGLSNDDGYGACLAVGADVIFVGAPYHDIGSTIGESNIGRVYQYSKSPGTASWTALYEQVKKPNVNKIKKAFLYNKATQDLVTYLDVIDPNQGKIPGIADQEIQYKTYFDPAIYTIGTEAVNVNDGTAWTKPKVGLLWWDLTRAKFLENNIGNVVYRSTTWNRLYDTASIDIYEWVESKYLPSEWDKLADTEKGLTQNVSGKSKYGDLVYSVLQKYDTVSKKFVNLYYFWVNGKTIVPATKNRILSAKEISNLIADPVSYGYECLALTGSNSFSLVNVAHLLKDTDVILSVQYWTIDNQEINIHSEWKLVSPSATTEIPPAIEAKWIHSLIGKDDNNKVVPNINLPAKQRYGVEFKPRQSMFVNRGQALKLFVDSVNSVFALNLITDNYDITSLEKIDEYPSKVSGKWDVTVQTNTDLKFISTGSLKVAVLIPVIENGKIISVIIDNPGFGYINAPYVTVIGAGINAEIQTKLDTNGSVVGVDIINSGSGYNSTSTILSIRSFSVLILNDIYSFNKWSIYTFDIATAVWSKTKSQTYNTRDFWNYIDWYAVGYNQYTKVDYTVENTYGLTTLQSTIGDIVKVNNIGTGGWVLLEKYSNIVSIDYTQNYKTIGRENGTIKLSETLYNYTTATVGFDSTLYDSTQYDKIADVELKIIIECIKNTILIGELRIHYINLFFSSLRYVLSEQPFVDWAVKTSFVKALHNVGTLKQKVTYNNDNLSDFESYVNEVKPYRTNVREYVSSYSNIDNTQTLVSDFDIIPYVNDEYQINSLRVEVKEVTDEVANIITSNPISDTYPWKNWIDNVGFTVTSIEVADSGSGYINPPVVRIVGGYGSGASAKAYISNGSVNRVTIINKGAGYLKAPTVIIDGGLSAGGTVARAVAIIETEVVRANKISMKFDRITNNYFVYEITETETFPGTGARLQFDLKYSPIKTIGRSKVVIDGTDVLRNEFVLTTKKSTTSGYTKHYGSLTLSSPPAKGATIVVTYEKDFNHLSAADRINFFYNPLTGQWGKDLAQLMTGIDYGGANITGVGFKSVGGWDALPWFSDAWDSFDEDFDNYTTVAGASTHSVTLPYVPESNTALNIYINRLVTENFVGTGSQTEFIIPNALSAPRVLVNDIELTINTDFNLIPYSILYRTLKFKVAPANNASIVINLYKSDVRLDDSNFSIDSELITFHGAPAYSTLNLPISGTDLLGFDGASYISAPADPDYSFGTLDFTVELFVRPNTLPGNAWTPILSIGQTNGGKEIRIGHNINDTGVGFVIPNNSNNGDIYQGFGHVLTPNNWSHLALVREGTNVYFFVNGIKVYTVPSVSFNFTGIKPLRIGYGFYSQDGYFSGSVSAIRMIKGTAVYTEDFEVPSMPLEVVEGTCFLQLNSHADNPNALMTTFIADGTTSTVTLPTYITVNEGDKLIIRKRLSDGSNTAVTGDYDTQLEGGQFAETTFMSATGLTPEDMPRSFLVEPYSFSGTNNNISNTSINAAGGTFSRYGQANYLDGIYEMVPGVNPRVISNVVVAGNGDLADPENRSAMMYAWGQLLSHDISFERQRATLGDRIEINVQIPPDDTGLTPGSFIPVYRVAVASGTGPDTNTPALPINDTTGWMDLSIIYGVIYPSGATPPVTAFEDPANLLDTTTGKLKTSIDNDGRINLPLREGNFYTGDPRFAENPDLIAMMTLLVREHNWQVDRLAILNPTWSAQQLFNQARATVTAEFQFITYNEWLPNLIGANALPNYTGYKPNVDPTARVEFTAAALRFGHSIVSNKLNRIDEEGNILAELPLNQAFHMSSSAFVQAGGADAFLRNICGDVSNALDVHMIDDLRNLLDAPPNAVDLAATNIQRGRDLGLGTLNQTRIAFGLAPYTSFSQITSDNEVVNSLAIAYGDIDTIDLWLGGLAEDHVEGAFVGQTFRAILIDAFTRLRDGDRLWYKNQTWSSDDINWIEATTLADVILRNTDTVRLQENVFYAVERADLYSGVTPPLAVARSATVPSILGTRPDDINIDGDGFITDTNSAAPEEILPGQVFDTLAIKVYHRPQGGAPKILFKNYLADGTFTDFKIGQYFPTDRSVIVKVGGIFLEKIEYTIDWKNNNIKLVETPAPGTLVSIVSFGFNASNILDLDYFVGDGVAREFITKAPWLNNLNATVLVNGQILNYTLFQTDDTYNTVNITGIRFGAPIEADAIINYMISTDSTSDVTAQTAAVVKSQTINYVSGTDTYALTNLNATNLLAPNLQPYENNVLVRNGQTILQPAKTLNFVLSNNNLEYTLSPYEATAAVFDITQIKVFIAGVQLQMAKDFTVDFAGVTIRISKLKYIDGAPMVVVISAGSDYTINSSGTITFTNDYQTNTKLEIISFYNHAILNIERSINTLTPVTELIPSSAEYFTFTKKLGRRFKLDKFIITDDYVWVIKNGKLLDHGVDYSLEKDHRTIRLQQSVLKTDTVQLIAFSSDTITQAVSYMQFKDVLNRVHFKRLNKNKQTQLDQDLHYNDTIILVKDASNFDVPSISSNKPGIIEIRGERIEFFEINGNMLTRLRRGTLGTGVPALHKADTYVIDIGPKETLPYSEVETIEKIRSDGTNIVPLTFVPTKGYPDQNSLMYEPTGVSTWFSNYGYKFSGAYSSSVLYTKNNVVVYNNVYYVNTVSSKNNAPTDTAYWTVFTTEIPPGYGQANDIEVFVGGYDVTTLWMPTTEYAVGDLITNGAYSYKCMTAHTSSNTFKPDLAKWKLFVGNIRLMKSPHSHHNMNTYTYSPEGDVKLDADFAVNGTSPALRLTNELAEGTVITVVKRTGTHWDNALYGNNKIASFLRAAPAVWYTDMGKYGSNGG